MISFAKNNKKIYINKKISLMALLLENQMPVASSCGGDGVCGKCKIKIISGHDQLSPPNEKEIFLKEKLGWDNHYRLSCQTFVNGNDLTIDTDYW